MFEWVVAERKDESLVRHLAETRKHLDEYVFGDVKTEQFYGYEIPDKLLMKDILKAATRIIKAVKNNEKIIIFGHDDVDGITSSYILFDLLARIGSYSHYYFIPNRLTDHHGIRDSFIRRVKQNSYTLVVTVDGGISSYEGIEELNKLGCDVIITDHHLIPEKVPTAYAIVNPKSEDCPYPDKMLAGVGIVYFLTQVICDLLSIPVPDKYLFWTTVGTISDKAPLTGVNRIICKTVFENWQTMIDRPLSLWSSRVSLNCVEFFEKSCFIGNMIKLLSSGRETDGENVALYFLLAPDYRQREVVPDLIKRKTRYENELLRVRDICDSLAISRDDLFFIHYDQDDEIPFGLISFAGLYLSTIYKIPVFVLKNKKCDKLNEEPVEAETGQEDRFYVVGEGKCPDTFDLIKALDHCSAALKQYGGHCRAAGLLTKIGLVAEFRKLFSEYAVINREEIKAGQVINIDAVVTKEELPGLRKTISPFSPFGEKSQVPVFLIRDINLKKTLADAISYVKEPLDSNRRYDVVFTFRCDGRAVLLDVETVKE